MSRFCHSVYSSTSSTFNLCSQFLVFVHPLYYHHYCPSCFLPCFSVMQVSSLVSSCQSTTARFFRCAYVPVCHYLSLPDFFLFPLNFNYFLFSRPAIGTIHLHSCVLNNVKQYKNNKQALAVVLTPKSYYISRHCFCLFTLNFIPKW